MNRRVLVAGIGNVFKGDDGFGVEVVQCLRRRDVPDGVVIVDFGVRGLHLAYELLEAPELLVVTDVVSRGGTPGTLYVIEPECAPGSPASADAHGMDLMSVFATLRALGGTVPRVLIVGCEPAELGDRMALSDVVAQSVDAAADLVVEILERETKETVR